MNSDIHVAASEIVKDLVNELGGPKAAAEKTGISVSTLQNWMRGASRAPYEGVFELQLAALTALDVPNASEAKRNTNQLQPNARNRLFNLAASRTQGKTGKESTAQLLVRRFDVQLSAGNGSFIDRASELSPIPFAEDFFGKKLTGRSASNMVIVDARGDSMVPVIGDGDLVMIDTSDTAPADAIYGISYDNALFVKRLVKRPDRIDLISSNPEYPVERVEGVDLDYLEIIGRVVWVGRTMV